MPRPVQRANLGSGLRLDLNQLARRGTVRRGVCSRPRGIAFINSYWGELASAEISADMSGERGGWFCVALDGESPQTIDLVAKPRHFGGVQWYFVCPVSRQKVSVIYRPPGATRFASRHAWGPRRVAYQSQFLDPDNRAHLRQSKIKNRLIGRLDPDEWDLPPKPKWMRWRTYHRVAERFERCDGILDEGLVQLAARFLRG